MKKPGFASTTGYRENAGQDPRGTCFGLSASCEVDHSCQPGTPIGILIGVDDTPKLGFGAAPCKERPEVKQGVAEGSGPDIGT